MAEASLIATWWGVAFAALFGLAGIIVGSIGIAQAKKARGAAASANLIAKDANSVARTANKIAEEANALATDANEMAAEQVEKGNELHRLDWDFRWTGLGVYQVANLGPDAARDIHIQITVAHDIKTLAIDQLADKEAVTLDFPNVRARLEDLPAMSGGYRQGVPPVMIRQLLTWRSPAGNPQKYDDSDYGARLQ